MTTSIQVSGTREAISYLEEIAYEMTRLFNISLPEARGRINHQLRNRSFSTPTEVNVLLHEEQDVWAKHIYYGRESFWWKDEGGMSPLPYSPQDDDE